MNRSIFAGLFVLILERFLQIITAIYANHLISNALPIEQFGIWQYAFTLTNILMSLTWMCGSESVVPQLSRLSLHKKLVYCNTIFFARLSISSLVALSSIILALTAKNEIVSYYLLFSSITILVREPLMVGFAKWQSEGKLYLSGIIQIFGCIIRIFTLYYLFIIIGFNLKFLSLPWVLEGIFVAIIMYCCSIRTLPKIKLLHFNELIILLKRSVFIWGGVIAYTLFIKIDRFLLKDNISSIDYSIYSAASQINENTISITLILIQILAPILLYRNRNWNVFNRNLIILSVTMFIVFLLFSISLKPFTPFIFTFIFGNDYITSSYYYNILVFLLPFLAVDNLINAANLASKSYYYFTLKWCIIFLVFLVIYSTLKIFSITTPIFSIFISLYASLFLSILISTYWYLTITKKHLMEQERIND